MDRSTEQLTMHETSRGQVAAAYAGTVRRTKPVDVGVIYDVKEIPPGKGGPGKGGKDWYRWGAEIIVANQKEEGQWEDRFPGVPDTCFALLFLKRANIAKDLTDKLRDVLGWNAVTAPPGGQTPLPPRKE